MDIPCHNESNTLCPSNKELIPDFPLVGNNFKNGVKFSVQTGSLGNAARNKYNLLPFSGAYSARLISLTACFGYVVM
ncbi:Uncharacterised protein [Chlamydia trachomatis]|nr:Uncharacterised protein [Chlamydia trachomatis]